MQGGDGLPGAVSEHQRGTRATRLSAGANDIRLLYSDGAMETQRACKDIGLVHEISRPGDAPNNGTIERASQETFARAAACLLQAGLPARLWVFAAPCYCALYGNDARATRSRWSVARGSELRANAYHSSARGMLPIKDKEGRDGDARASSAGGRVCRLPHAPWVKEVFGVFGVGLGGSRALTL